jgi:hypothetical protein
VWGSGELEWKTKSQHLVRQPQAAAVVAAVAAVPAAAAAAAAAAAVA